MIEGLFREHLRVHVLSTRDLSVGCEQKVWRVETSDGPYILKEPFRDPLINAREEIATDLCRRHGVPAPRVVWCDDRFLIQECLDGVPLDQANLSSADRETVFYELGVLLRQMHTIELEGFGPLTRGGRGEEDDYLEFYLKRRDSGERKGARRYFKEHEHLLCDRTPVLVHFDIEEEHVFVKGGKIVGLVDFATAFSGAPAEDFTRMFSLRWKDPLFTTLLEGYRDLTREEVEFFTFLHLHWRIPWHVKKGNRPQKIMLLTELYSRLVRTGSSS